MQVYIAVDMEGATGIASTEQCRKGSDQYHEGRRYLTDDVNAVIAGVREGGAETIIVADMHSTSFNLIHDQMDPGVSVVYGVPGRAPRFPGLTQHTDAMMLVAYHARASTPQAVLDHTMSSKTIARQWINGIEVGEVGIDAGIAGVVGVPVIFVSGDDKVCREAEELLGPVHTAAVKQGIARQRALCLGQQEALRLLKTKAREALLSTSHPKPLDLGNPVKVVVEYKDTALVDGTDLDSPNIQRLDGRCVSYSYPTVADAYGGLTDNY